MFQPSNLVPIRPLVHKILHTSVTPMLVKFELFRFTVSLTRARSPKPNTCSHVVSMQILHTSVTQMLVKYELFCFTVCLKTRTRSPNPNTCSPVLYMQICFKSQDILQIRRYIALESVSPLSIGSPPKTWPPGMWLIAAQKINIFMVP